MIPDDNAPLWWLWCGQDEATALIVGPILDEELATIESTSTTCDHNHAKFNASLRWVAQRMPEDLEWDRRVSDQCRMLVFDHKTVLAPPLAVEGVDADAVLDRIVALVRIRAEAEQLLTLNA